MCNVGGTGMGGQVKGTTPVKRHITKRHGHIALGKVEIKTRSSR